MLTVARDYVGVLAATILFIATNAGLIGISRLSWSLSEHRQLPSIFSQLHPTLPHAVVHDRVLLDPRGPADPPRRDRRCSATSTRSARCCRSRPPTSAVVALRIKDPDRERPYRMPWNVRIRGRQIPMTAVLGGDRHVRRVGRGRRAAPRGAARRHPLDGRSGWAATSSTASARVSSLRKQRTRSPRPERPPDFEELELPHGARADLRRRRQRVDAAQRGEADRRGRRRLRGLRAARAQPAVAARRASRRRRRTGARCSRARASRPAAPGIKIRTGLIRTRNPGAALVDEAAARSART